MGSKYTQNFKISSLKIKVNEEKLISAKTDQFPKVDFQTPLYVHKNIFWGKFKQGFILQLLKNKNTQEKANE